MHRAAHAGRLVDALADLLAQPADVDPFMPEVVAVPSRGIERWLAQELSLRLGATPGRRDGVCANVHFPFPATVVGWALRAAEGGAVDVRGRDVPDDPWSPARLTWHLLDVVAAGGAGDLGAFGAHLAGEHGMARRLPALRHVADLFDRYAVHRPDMVRAWLDGRDVDGAGGDLPDTAGWQPRLWRAVRQHLDAPSYPERVSEAVAHLDARGPVPGVPSRLALYGLTALPATHVEVLDALAAAHDVHLFLLHPSPALWQRMSDAPSGGRVPRESDETRTVPQHPLVASWGRDARELQVVLAGRGVDHPHDPPTEEAPQTLLARLQSDIVANEPPPGPSVAGSEDRREPLAVTAPAGAAHRRAVDRSVQVHACHGRLRQVEVLRDAVLGLMSDDPTIQPRDVVVMCPDVEAFAPLVDAVFGADTHVASDDTDEPAGGALPDVRVRLADRALRQVNPLLRTMADVLRLPDGRVESTTVLDLLQRGPVRRRFDLSDDDLASVQEWVQDLQVRWGIDAAHRHRHFLETDANTWRRGLDRLLLGVAITEDGPRTVAGLVPHDDVEGGAVDLAGRLAEVVERVGMVVDGLSEPRPVAAWCQDLRRAARLLTDVDVADEWQRLQFDRLVDELWEAAGGASAPAVPVTLSEVRALLDDRLRGRPSRANHRTGDLTVCTLVPMRSVPYRVVCLLGLDDETFPRRTVASGDDLISLQPLVGDRDARTEDRQLLLDALLAAGDHLVVTYRGRDERTDAVVPPAVPLAELLDLIDQTVRPADGHGDARDLVVAHQPLRAADTRTFTAEDPFGFDPVALDGARARLAPPQPAPRFLDGLPAAGTAATTIEWAEFVRFLHKPVEGWLRARLDVSLRGEDEPVDDLLPFELQGLNEWDVGTRLLRGAMVDELDAWMAAERSRGTLPVGQIGEGRLAEVVEDIRAIRDAAASAYGARLATPVETVEVDLRVGDLHLVGTIAGVGPDLFATVDFGRPKAKRLLRTWLPWLALQEMGVGREAVLVTRGKKPTKGVRKVERARLTVLPADPDPTEVAANLLALADLFERGHDQPLPVFEECTPAYVKARIEKKDRQAALAAARREWAVDGWAGGRPYGDGLTPAVVQVFGRVEFDEIVALAPLDTDSGDGWDTDASRFCRLAWRIWDPILTTCVTQGVST